MNPLASELNAVLDGSVAGRLLSSLGRRLFFPKGIIAQSSEAKQLAPVKNATIGMAFHKGQPLILSAIRDSMPTLTAKEAVTYAATAGVEEVRKAWKESMAKKNPSLKPEDVSLPAAVPGITAGISFVADLFLDENNTIIASDPCWDNYSLIFTERRGAELRGVPFFGTGPGLDLEAIRRVILEEAKTGQVRIIFNFPNNPSGYSPTQAEADALIEIIRETAEAGADVLVICDDAYFGLYYEDGIYRESLFGRLASLHERVLAVKIDGPTKEDYVWGLRVAFVTFGSPSLKTEHQEALGKKLMGGIRSSVSCANTPAQYLILKVLSDPRTPGEKKANHELLRSRYQAVKDFIRNQPEQPKLKPLPFNSGYFMSFRCIGIDAEALRKQLLADHGIGTIALGAGILRVAFAALEKEQIPGIYSLIYETAGKL
ncbi:aspartate aminotransferase [Treponema primitia ZAS-2]|uniref:Aspartate aminotransferase n=1 Tax=Treponema primitia (strain ATCC BAA-887 / DSM 12427 / ZAS-2) TaxID=545694 RepID=F5YKV6_TREPZ|nr:aminotransferase class I/II-fold pyridoxal phosphate-dependent enzyme [Treponema primitia]AEF85930.1 aspartate aminotransferase [Treponema primitia ZAS-2]